MYITYIHLHVENLNYKTYYVEKLLENYSLN